MYKNGQELLDLCAKEHKRAWEVALDAETKLTGMAREKVWAHFDARLDVMIGSATKALEHKQATKGSLVDGVANCQYQYSQKDGSVTGNYMNYIMALAYSSSEVNASMGKTLEQIEASAEQVRQEAEQVALGSCRALLPSDDACRRGRRPLQGV